MTLLDRLDRARTSSTMDDARDLVVRAGAAGFVAAISGLALSVCLVVGVWVMSPHGTDRPGDALRVAAAVWLVAHHVQITTAVGQLALAPMGLLVIPVGLVYAAGRYAGRRLEPQQPADVVRIVFALALGYTLVTTSTAGLISGAMVAPDIRQAVFFGAAISILGGGAGVLRVSGLGPDLLARVPTELREALAAGVAACLVIIGGGAVLAGVAIARGASDGAEVLRTLQPGAVGGLALAAVSLALLPNLIVWACAYVVGPGFAVGAGTDVSMHAVHTGPLPALPVLTAIPREGTTPAIAMALLLVPLCAGVVAGLLVHLRVNAPSSESAAGWAALGGLFAGAIMALLAYLSGGSAGAARMSVVGPSPAEMGLVVMIEVGLVAAAVAWEARRRFAPGRFRPTAV